MAVCADYKISHSHFLGGPNRWTPADRDKAIWWYVREKERWGGGGGPQRGEGASPRAKANKHTRGRATRVGGGPSARGAPTRGPRGPGYLGLGGSVRVMGGGGTGGPPKADWDADRLAYSPKKVRCRGCEVKTTAEKSISQADSRSVSIEMRPRERG